MGSPIELSGPRSHQTTHRNRTNPSTGSSILNLCKSPVRLCPHGSGGQLHKRENEQSEIGQRSENIFPRFHCCSQCLANRRSFQLPRFPKRSVTFRSSTKGLPATSSWQSPLGSQLRLMPKKENPVRRRLEIKAGGYTYILEHACPGDRRIFTSGSDKMSIRSTELLGYWNVTPGQSFGEKKHSPPALQNDFNCTEL